MADAMTNAMINAMADATTDAMADGAVGRLTDGGPTGDKCVKSHRGTDGSFNTDPTAEP